MHGDGLRGDNSLTSLALRRRLRVDDLRYLLAIARTGRVNAAADQLGVDHSTASRRLSALERVLGARLVERGSEGWELTDLGRAVVEQAKPIETAFEGVVRAVQGARDDVISGNFRITAPDGFATVFVVPALTRLRDKHPDLDVELLTATRQLNLHQSGFDLAIAVGLPSSPKLVTEQLCHYRLALYATADYLTSRGRPANLEELRQHTVISYVDSMLQVGDLDLSRYVPGIEGRFTSTNIFAQLEATACGAGIGLLPRFMALRRPQLVELDDLQVDVRLSFTVAARRHSVSRPAIQAVLRAIGEETHRRAHELVG